MEFFSRNFQQTWKNYKIPSSKQFRTFQFYDGIFEFGLSLLYPQPFTLNFEFLILYQISFIIHPQLFFHHKSTVYLTE